jgi:hypothetical protein
MDVLFDNDEVANRWKEYLKDLYIGETWIKLRIKH